MSLGIEFIYWVMEGKGKSGKEEEREREREKGRKEKDGSTERVSSHLFRRRTRERDS